MSSPRALRRRRAAGSAQALVDWYRQKRRDLPWRRTRDPYAIWVSEVMLQQTRVETVAPRWERFLDRFPDLSTLAEASSSDVLAEWAGLGYYRRARQLHAAARAVAEKEGGELPRTAAGLRLLPGFGAYTAGAVASIAYDEPVPAVDGNVERVISRLLALEGEAKRGDTARAILESARLLVEQAKPSELNQALMELGALVCVPRNPKCGECPWRRRCAARASGVPESFPRSAPPRQSVDVTAYAAVQRRGDRLLFRRRPEGVVNAGLWELPTSHWQGEEPNAEAAGSALSELAVELGTRWRLGEPLARIRHGITHHRVTVVGYSVEGDDPGSEESRWASPEEARSLGLTAAATKLIKKLPTLL